LKKKIKQKKKGSKRKNNIDLKIKMTKFDTNKIKSWEMKLKNNFNQEKCKEKI
jgi:hypothetical protein